MARKKERRFLGFRPEIWAARVAYLRNGRSWSKVFQFALREQAKASLRVNSDPAAIDRMEYFGRMREYASSKLGDRARRIALREAIAAGGYQKKKKRRGRDAKRKSGR